MRWGWGLRLLAAVGMLAAVAPAAEAGPGHGDVFKATHQSIPADATVGAFADAPAFLAGELRVSDGTLVQICAYTVTDKDGVPLGVRAMAAAYKGVPDAFNVRTDDVFSPLSESQFIYTTEEHSWSHTWRHWNVLRLFVYLPRIGGFLELLVGQEAPGTLLHAGEDPGDHVRHGYEAVIVNGHRGADAVWATLGPKVAEWRHVVWGSRAAGGCWATYPDPGQITRLVPS